MAEDYNRRSRELDRSHCQVIITTIASSGVFESSMCLSWHDPNIFSNSGPAELRWSLYFHPLLNSFWNNFTLLVIRRSTRYGAAYPATSVIYQSDFWRVVIDVIVRPPISVKFTCDDVSHVWNHCTCPKSSRQTSGSERRGQDSLRSSMFHPMTRSSWRVGLAFWSRGIFVLHSV